MERISSSLELYRSLLIQLISPGVSWHPGTVACEPAPGQPHQQRPHLIQGDQYPQHQKRQQRPQQRQQNTTNKVKNSVLIRKF